MLCGTLWIPTSDVDARAALDRSEGVVGLAAVETRVIQLHIEQSEGEMLEVAPLTHIHIVTIIITSFSSQKFIIIRYIKRSFIHGGKEQHKSCTAHHGEPLLCPCLRNCNFTI